MCGKGLCITCAKDKNCAFTKKYPVVYCEEFNDEQEKHGAVRSANKRHKN